MARKRTKKYDNLDDILEQDIDENIDALDQDEIERNNKLRNQELEGDSLGRFFHEIGQARLLTANEEVELAKTYERGRAAEERLSKGDLSEDEQETARAEAEAGVKAKHKLIEHNLRLVISIARRYVGHGLPLSDLIAEGNFGLIRAVEKYDWKRGFRFSTYATWWIRQAVTRGLADSGRTIRLPVHVGEALTKIGRESQDLSLKLDREPSPEELSEATGLSPERIEEYLQAAHLPMSLEAPIGDDDAARLGDVIEDTNISDPADIAANTMLGEDIKVALSRLTEKQRSVIVMRYGLDNDDPMTLEAIGKRLGVTRERARQIEQEAMRILRQPESTRVLESHAA